MKYDLLIREGEVTDPGGGLRGRMDVRIVGGQIAEVAPMSQSASYATAISSFATPAAIRSTARGGSLRT
jgi:N-acyl-D-aspartate/D-glutamate deacylase